MGQANHGLEKIELSPLAADGGVGTAWATLGWTEEDSAKFSTADADKKEFFVEEIDAAWFSTSKGGSQTFTFTIANPDLNTMVTLFGGTITGTGAAQTWDAPDTTPTMERSLKITPKVGFGHIFAYVTVTAKLTESIGRNHLQGVEVTCNIGQPKKAGEKRWRMFQKVA